MKRPRKQAVPRRGGRDAVREGGAADKEAAQQAGAWLKELGRRAGLSQIELADVLGFKYYTLFPRWRTASAGCRPRAWKLGARARSRPVGVRAQAAVLLRSGTVPAAVRGEEMNVVKFPRVQPQAAAGLAERRDQQILAACAGSIRPASQGWEVGATEHGDPQLYLLGPPPELRLHPVHLARSAGSMCSRTARPRAVRARQSDAAGRAGDCGAAPPQGEPSLARVAVAWARLREAFEEKVEPMLAEPMEVLTHVAPQLAALA